MSLQDNLKSKKKVIKKNTMDQKGHTLYFAIKSELILTSFFCLSLLYHVFLSPQ